MKHKMIYETGRGRALHSVNAGHTRLNLVMYFRLALSPRMIVKTPIKNEVLRYLAFLVLTVVLSSTVHARRAADYRPGSQSTSMASPAYCLARHDIGNVVFGVSNNGTIGTQYSSSGIQDCFTGERVPAFEFPKGSNTRYLYGAALWIGAVIGHDTLVSVGQDGWQGGFAEFHPDEAPLGNMKFRSTIDPSKPEYDGAVSEQDYIAVYTDTFTSGVAGLRNDVIDNRPHMPLFIEVTQRSFAWSYSYADDFVLFDFGIKNIGAQRLSQVYLGFYVDADVHAEANQYGFFDDICGFLHSMDAGYLPAQCPDTDVTNMAWIADSDGDFGMPPGMEVPDVTGMRIVRTPSESSVVSFNWWIGNGNPELDFGPMSRDKVRDYTTGGTGTPEGDRNKYFVLSNGEFDYDQIFTASVSDLDPIWLPPNPVVKEQLSRGFDTRYLLSVGPFDVEPGQTLPLTFAYVGGENLHVDPNNYADNLVNNYNPAAFYDNLDFSDFGLNATWAEWIYDNPGVDSDGDGYAGELDTCDLGGSNYVIIPRSGDGVPDFCAAGAPPAPVFWIEPLSGALNIRWNGLRSEITPDNFSQELDFEGYNVYLSHNPAPSGFALLATYDIENYRKYVWSDFALDFVLIESPFGLGYLRCLYAPGGCNDTTWHPSDWTRSRPFVYSAGATDSIFYFEQVGCNASRFGFETPFLKRFPGAEEPLRQWLADTTMVPDSLRDATLTEDGYFKYYEYEYRIVNLLPGIPYWVSVTAYDYGSWRGTSSQESPISDNAQQGTPLAGIPVCCVGLTGNVDGDPSDNVDIGDLAALVDYLFITNTVPECMEEANADSSIDGVVDIGDLTVLIDYLFISFTPPAKCL